MRRALRPSRLAIAAALAAALAAGCTTSGSERPDMEGAAQEAGGVQKATLDLHSFYFEPNRLVVRAGVPVELTLHSRATIIGHNFTIKAPEAGIDVDEDVGARAETVVRFTPTKAGAYPFVCGKGSHMAKGMAGTLIVRE